MSLPDFSQAPAALGYRFPAEWEPHVGTWLSFPHKEASWPGKLESIYPTIGKFIAAISQGEEVHINVLDTAMERLVLKLATEYGAVMHNIYCHYFATNDAWCRDHGPAFLVHPSKKRLVVDWGYNAWGDKYPPYDLDDVIPTRVGEYRGLDVVYPGIVMEGGSVEFNGEGVLLTSEACLLNPNRNPHLNQDQIETYLKAYYGVHTIWWLGDGIVGDDTDGHIDDMTRFVNANTLVTVREANPEDENHAILEENYERLQQLRFADGSQPNIVALPMPKPVIWEEQRLPASYANFYFCNHACIVPTFQDEVNDEKALGILREVITDREVIGIDSTDLIWGLGSFHCLSQQEPRG